MSNSHLKPVSDEETPPSPSSSSGGGNGGYRDLSERLEKLSDRVAQVSERQARLETEFKEVVKKSDLAESISELKDFVREENKAARKQSISLLILLVAVISASFVAYGVFFK